MDSKKKAPRARGGKVGPARLGAARTTIAALRGWKLEDAKARFSEVVRLAREKGPQRVTYRGKDAVVVISVEELKRLLPAERPRQSLVDYLRNTALAEIDIHREPDRGRDIVW